MAALAGAPKGAGFAASVVAAGAPKGAGFAVESAGLPNKPAGAPVEAGAVVGAVVDAAGAPVGVAVGLAKRLVAEAVGGASGFLSAGGANMPPGGLAGALRKLPDGNSFFSSY